MIRYIRVTNGGVTMLVNPYDNVKLNELIQNGFYLEKDNNGNYAVMNSTDLLEDNNDLQRDIFNNLEERYGQKSNLNNKKRAK